jgi:spore coat protein CotH
VAEIAVVRPRAREEVAMNARGKAHALERYFGLAAVLGSLCAVGCSSSGNTGLGTDDAGADAVPADTSFEASPDAESDAATEAATDAATEDTADGTTDVVEEVGDGASDALDASEAEAASEASDASNASDAATYTITYSPLTDTSKWTAETHGKLATAAIKTNLSKVFDETKVQRLDIVIENANWLVMKQNLADLKAKLGGSPDFSTIDDPITVPCEVFHDGIEWYKVGIRFKGNSSLFNAGSNKVPFKLKFNDFESTYAAIAGQRYYGFKTLHLKSNYEDPTELHELMVDDMFRDFGLASPHASFYELWIDVGDGAGKRYFGLYTVVEDVEDTVIKTQYATSSGNLYKPEGAAAAFASGSYATSQFYLKTNTSTATYADVKATYDAINDSTTFASDPATWRAHLEAAFDAPRFMKWLAANTVLQDWDTYGVMTHNYYLYANPDRASVLEWIPWDNNEAMTANSQCLSLDMATVTTSWPLIYWPMRDATYLAAYQSAVASFANDHYSNAKLDAVIDGLVTQIQPFVNVEVAGWTYTSPTKFTNAITTMKAQIGSRNAAALAYAK